MERYQKINYVEPGPDDDESLADATCVPAELLARGRGLWPSVPAPSAEDILGVLHGEWTNVGAYLEDVVSHEELGPDGRPITVIDSARFVGYSVLPGGGS